MNEGCTPTKTLITSGRVAHLARRGPDYGIHTSPFQGSRKPEVENQIEVDMKKIRQRKRDIVTSFRTGSEKRTEGAGVHVLMGTARFVDEKTVAVKGDDGNETIVEGEKIFINVGERPSSPHLAGIETIDSARVRDSTSIQELDEVPTYLVVVGGGYVGVEFAQLFGRLGAKVTILQRGKQLLPREDAEIASELSKILVEDGIEILLQSTASSISPAGSTAPTGSGVGFDLTVTPTAMGASETRTVQGSHILFAAGRVPNSDTLNLAAAGVAMNEKGYIVTDEYLATNIPHIFAMGDVNGPPAFTHISYDDFRIIEANHLSSEEKGVGKKSTKDRLVPYVVYTDPQLAHVGLHEAEARRKFPDRDIKTAKMPM